MSEEPIVEVALRQLSLQQSMDISAGVRPRAGWADDFPQRGDIAATRYTSSASDTERFPWSASWLIIVNGLVAGTLLELVREYPVTAETASWNVASQRVVQKAGFTEFARRTTEEDGELIVWRFTSTSL
jgi:hypothetical protein